MPWWGGLAPETISELLDRYPGRTLEQIGVEIVRAHPELFAALGVEIEEPDTEEWHAPGLIRIPDDVGAEPRLYIPEDNTTACRDLIVALAPKDEAPAPVTADVDRGGRPPGSYVDTTTFWRVFGMAVEENASARQIESVTKKRATLRPNDEDWLEYVNRDKAGAIVETVKLNPIAARQSLSGRRPPRGFSATRYGVLLPKRKPA